MPTFFKTKKSSHDLAEWSKHDEKLLHAVEKGEIDKINSILSSKKSVSPTKLDPHGHTCMHRAAIEGNKSVMEALLNHNADPNATDLEGRTPLHCAVGHGHLEVAALLIQHDSGLYVIDRHKLSTLHYAVMGGSVDCVRLLLDNGAPVYPQDEDGRPALFLAAQMNHVPITKELIEGGANVNTRDSKQKTALILASEYGNDDVVQFLISRGANVTLADEEERSAIDYAKDNEKEDIVQMIGEAPEPKQIDFDYLKPAKPESKPKRRPKPAYRIDMGYSQNSIVEEATPPPSTAGSDHTDNDLDKSMDLDGSIVPIGEFPEEEDEEKEEEEEEEDEEIEEDSEDDEDETETEKNGYEDDRTEAPDFLDSGYQDDHHPKHPNNYIPSGPRRPPPARPRPPQSRPSPPHSGDSTPGARNSPPQTRPYPIRPAPARPSNSKHYQEDEDDSHSDYPLSPEPESIEFDRRDYQDLLVELNNVKGDLAEVINENRTLHGRVNHLQTELGVDAPQVAVPANGRLEDSSQTKLYLLQGLVTSGDGKYVSGLEKELEAIRKSLGEERDRNALLEEDIHHLKQDLDDAHTEVDRVTSSENWLSDSEVRSQIEQLEMNNQALRNQIKTLSAEATSRLGSGELSKSEGDLRDLAGYKELQEAHEREVQYFMGKLDQMEAEKDNLAKKIINNDTLEKKIEDVQKSISELMQKESNFDDDDMEKLHESVMIIRDRSPSRASLNETLKAKEILDDENVQLKMNNNDMLQEKETMQEELDELRGQMAEVEKIISSARDLKMENDGLRADYEQFKNLLSQSKNAEVAEKADLMTWFTDINEENADLREKNSKLADQLQELEGKLHTIIALGDMGEPDEVKLENVKLRQDIENLQAAIERQAASIVELDEQIRNTKNTADGELKEKIATIARLETIIAASTISAESQRLDNDLTKKQEQLDALDRELGDKEILQNNYKKLLQDNSLLETEVADIKDVLGLKIEELEKERTELKKKLTQSDVEKKNLEEMLNNTAADFGKEREMQKTEVRRMHLVIIGLKEKLDQKRKLTDDDLKRYDGEILPSIVYKVEKSPMSDEETEEEIRNLQLEIYELKHSIDQKDDLYASEKEELILEFQKMKKDCENKGKLADNSIAEVLTLKAIVKSKEAEVESVRKELEDAQKKQEPLEELLIAPNKGNSNLSAAPPALPTTSPPKKDTGNVLDLSDDEDVLDLHLGDELRKAYLAKKLKEKKDAEPNVDDLKEKNVRLAVDNEEMAEEITALKRTIQELKVYLEKKVEDWEDDPNVSQTRINHLYVLLQDNPDNKQAQDEYATLKELETLQTEVRRLQKISNEREKSARKSMDENVQLKQQLQSAKSVEDEHAVLLKDNDELAVQLSRNTRTYRDQIERLTREKEHLVEENETLKTIIEGTDGDSDRDHLAKHITMLMTTKAALEFETKRLVKENEKLKVQYEELRAWAKKEQSRLTEEIQTWKIEIELLRKIPAEERARLYVENVNLRAELESLREQLGDKDVEEVVFRGQELVDLKAEIEALLNKSYLDDVEFEENPEADEDTIVPVESSKELAAAPPHTENDGGILTDVMIVEVALKEDDRDVKAAFQRMTGELDDLRSENERFIQENKHLAAEVFSMKLTINDLKQLEKENGDLLEKIEALRRSVDETEGEIHEVRTSNSDLNVDKVKLNDTVTSLKSELEKRYGVFQENEELKRDVEAKAAEIKKMNDGVVDSREDELKISSAALLVIKKKNKQLEEEQDHLVCENEDLKHSMDDMRQKLQDKIQQMTDENEHLVDRFEKQQGEIIQIQETTHQDTQKAEEEQNKTLAEKAAVLAELSLIRERAKRREQELEIMNDELEEENIMLRSEVDRLDQLPKITPEMEEYRQILEDENDKLNSALDELQATLMEFKRQAAEQQRRVEDDNTMLKSDIAILDAIPKYTKELQEEHQRLEDSSVMLNNDMEELRGLFSEERSKLENLKEENEFMCKDLEKLKDLREEKAQLSFKNETLTNELESLSALSSQQGEELEENRTEIDKTKTEKETITNENGRLLLLIASVEKKLKEKAEECQEKVIENDFIGKECGKLADQNDDLKSEVDRSTEKIKQMELTCHEIDDLRQNNAQFIMVIGDLKRDLKTSEQDIQCLKAEYDTLQADYNIEKEALDELHVKLEAEGKRLDEAESSVDNLKADKEELIAIITENATNVAEMNKQRAEFENRLKGMDELMKEAHNASMALDYAEKKLSKEHNVVEKMTKDLLKVEEDKSQTIVLLTAKEKELNEETSKAQELAKLLENRKEEFQKLAIMIDNRETELGDREEEIEGMTTAQEELKIKNKELLITIKALKDASKADDHDEQVKKLVKENSELGKIIEEIKRDMDQRLPKIEELEKTIREKDEEIRLLKDQVKNPLIVEEIIREETKLVEAAPPKSSTDSPDFVDDLKKQNEQLRLEIQELKEQLDKLKTSEKSGDEDLKKKNAALVFEVIALKELVENAKKGDDVDELQEELESLREQLDDQESKAKDNALFRKRIESLEEALDASEEEVDNLVRKNKQLKDEIHELELRLSTLPTPTQYDDADDAERYSEENQALRHELARLDNELKEAQTVNKEKFVTISAYNILLEENQDLCRELKNAEEDMAEQEQSKPLQAQPDTGLGDELKELQSEVVELRNDNSEQKQQTEDLEDRLKKAKDQIMLLEIAKEEKKDSVPLTEYTALLDKNMVLVSKIAELQENQQRKNSTGGKDKDADKIVHGEMTDLRDLNEKLRLEILELRSQLEKARAELMIIDIRHEGMVNEAAQTELSEPTLLEQIAELRNQLAEARKPEVIDNIVPKKNEQVSSRPPQNSTPSEEVSQEIDDQIIPVEKEQLQSSEPSSDAEVVELKKVVKELKLEISRLTEELDRSYEAQKKVEEFQIDNKSLRQQVLRLEEQLSDLQLEHTNLQSKCDSTSEELSDAHTRIIGLTRQASKDDTSENAEVTLLLEKNNMLAETLESIQQKYDQTTHQLRLESAEVMELKDTNRELKQKLNKLHNQLDILHQDTEDISKLKEDFRLEKMQLLDELDQQRRAVHKNDLVLTKEQVMLQAQLADIQTERQEHAIEIEGFQKEIDSLQREMREVRAERLSHITEIHHLKSVAITHGYFTDARPNTLVSRLKEENCKLQEFVAKLHTRLDQTRTRTIRTPVTDSLSEHRISLVAAPHAPTQDVQELERQARELRLQLLESERKHSEIICTYRTHLLAAVQGCIDPEVKNALMHIIYLRSEVRGTSIAGSEQSDAS